MMTIETMLTKELDELKLIAEESRIRLSASPSGLLRVAQKQGKYEYYLKEDDYAYSNGRYLRKDEKDIAIAVAQRDYDMQVVKKAEERIKEIERFLDKYGNTSLKEIYTKMSLGRRELIGTNLIDANANPDTYLVPDDVFVKQWLAVEYESKMFSDDDNDQVIEQAIITERGERVRSKSEKIIADKLYMLGIPYRYEYPILLEGYNGYFNAYPDFTILRMPDRQEVYFEHFGLMDEVDYVNTVMRKLDTYERNGIYLGVNLFFTHETSKRPLNTVALDRLLRELFCEC